MFFTLTILVSAICVGYSHIEKGERNNVFNHEALSEEN